MKNIHDHTENPVAWKTQHDQIGREKKADKILSVLKDYYSDISVLDLIDLSCSTGFMTRRFGKEFNNVIGIDIDKQAVKFAQQQNDLSNVKFIEMDAQHIEFGNESFDVVICNQMYEHVTDANLLMEEIHRILRPGGICYFGAGNRLTPVDPHYGKLPFISWLPKPMAHFYLRILGKGRYYDVYLNTYWTLKKMVRKFEVIDYTNLVVKDVRRFKMEDLIEPNSIKQRLALFILNSAYWIFPGYIWLLKKPNKKN